ncbi:hypothetical protein ERJ75_000554600 [Trypanosoma vivax]|nr:hypothetical protein ERJ75_000554600 [Trypanosoma vivax]
MHFSVGSDCIESEAIDVSSELVADGQIPLYEGGAGDEAAAAGRGTLSNGNEAVRSRETLMVETTVENLVEMTGLRCSSPTPTMNHDPRRLPLRFSVSNEKKWELTFLQLNTL